MIEKLEELEVENRRLTEMDTCQFKLLCETEETLSESEQMLHLYQKNLNSTCTELSQSSATIQDSMRNLKAQFANEMKSLQKTISQLTTSQHEKGDRIVVLQNTVREKQQMMEDLSSQYEQEKTKLKTDYNDVCLLYHETFASLDHLKKERSTKKDKTDLFRFTCTRSSGTDKKSGRKVEGSRNESKQMFELVQSTDMGGSTIEREVEY